MKVEVYYIEKNKVLSKLVEGVDAREYADHEGWYLDKSEAEKDIKVRKKK